ncbi:NAD(P)-dependent dehydrogenase, short-chain alcohol dehydrogenase family [Streptosporangium subroseum]|uniref:NAD(P)-dependent dehydrogenase, short-chain alcohol dehydrogenase family n=1 Tax=Streptosporangium subroseum TaxID=106412 RepID=A0A239CC22_9ACTN|nr:SDR family oxidoreductase [Streptosporangium subroseum]SNS17208.1 NAD(P)-dependent dehydrogenase, short-chain alcohol dehydrogenase family [Streptosporangium subroseum]
MARRVALVTGGSRGIGAAIALRLAAEGTDVVITYTRSAERAAAVVKEIEAAGARGLAVAMEAADAGMLVSAVERTVAEFGRIDILVSNAGVAPFGPLHEVTLAEVDSTLAIHSRASFVLAQAAARHMGRGGRIICIGSSLAERVPYPGWTLYAMSKSALTGLTKGLARDLGPRGITANLVHPGSTDTEMNPADSPDAEEERRFTALDRYCSPGDIAATVAHLAGEGGRNITGAAITVDAGTTA